MDKIKIELEYADAENLRRLLGSMNYYLIGAALSRCDDDTIPETEFDEVLEQTRSTVTRAYFQLERLIGDLK